MLFYLVAVYLLSSIPIGFLLTKWLTGTDLRKVGNRKVSVGNAIKNVDIRISLVFLILNLTKGYLAVCLAQYFGFNLKVQVAAGVLVVTAQLWPLFFKFWGGVGFTVSIGALLFLSPKIALGAIVVRILIEVVVEYFGLLPEGESLGISLSLLLVITWGFLGNIQVGIFGVAVFILVHIARLLGIPGSLKKIDSKKTLFLRLLYNQGIKRG